MKKLLSHSRVRNYTLGIFLVALLTLGLSQRSYAQALTRPILPYLSLTGGDDKNEQLYPDARIWLPPSTSKTREFLLPVWIRNDWYQIENDNSYIPLPIHSFSFSLLYDSSAVRVVGYELDHPNYMDQLGITTPEEPPTAKGFSIAWDDQRDSIYWKQIQQSTWEANKNQAARGRLATFSGSSPLPLPHNSSFEPRAWKVLMYVRFKVVGREREGDPNKTWQQTPIYIDNRSIRYNDFDITKDEPKKAMKYWDPIRYPIDYPSADVNKGMLGIRNDDLIGEELNPNFQIEPYRPGTIFLHLTDQEPNFYFPSDPSLGYTISNPTPGYFELDLPITVDADAGDVNGLATQIVKLENNVTSTRLTQVEIESDQPWLKFRTVKIASSDENPIPNPVRYGYINYIDNDILGSRNNPRGAATVAQGKMNLQIIADPAALKLNDPNDPEKSGIYVGYLTFKSPYAKTNPVRMKVTFIYLRNPFEPAGDQNPLSHPGGIILTLRNSQGTQGQEVDLTFGTGDRATDEVDPLYGERAATAEMSPTEFGARFFYNPQIYPDLATKYPYGLGDLTPNRTSPRSVSRDIRSNVTSKSHIYYVRFNAGSAQAYPVTLTWDVSQFPEGARVYLRDTQNGALFPATDMRNATSVEAPNIFGYTFTDARINDFIIEYTLPRTVDETNGMPVINRGWNLLSLPLRPLNAHWKTVFPNAINVPYFFSQNQYQSEEVLRPGVGYFVKYGDAVDHQFAGTEMYEISVENPPFDAIRVYKGDKGDPDQPEFYGGWNCIGALSVPINVSDIEFTRFQNSPVPDKSYTSKYGIWKYTTGRGYEEVSELLPGLGYWIKVNSDGYLKLVAPFIPKKESVSDFTKNDILAASTKLALRDNSSNSYELYLNSNASTSMFELPPAPPVDLFDVRFGENTYLSASNEALVRLQSVTYPVSVNVTNSKRDITIVDAGTGRIFGTVKRGENKEIVIDNAPFDAIRVLTSGSYEMGLTIGSNPVATSTNVNYVVSEDANVSIEIYDALGNKVSTLAAGQMAAGVYNVSLDAANLANGAYIVKFTQNDATVTAKISVVK